MIMALIEHLLNDGNNNHSGITRKERLMRKTNLSLLTDWFASHILHRLGQSIADTSPLHSFTELHWVAPFDLQPYNAFEKCFLKTMEMKKKSFLIFPRGRNNDNVVQISSLTNIAPS